MSVALGTEVGAGALPLTGSGPFSVLIGLLGVSAVGIGALLTRVAQRDKDAALATATHLQGRPVSSDLSANGAIPQPFMNEAVAWLDAQLGHVVDPAVAWLEEQLTGSRDPAIAWLDDQLR